MSTDFLIISCTYRFPSDEMRKKQWIENIRRKDWHPSKSSVVCSDHFCESYIDRSKERVKLRKDAVPTRFKKFPTYLKKVLYQKNALCRLL